MLISLMQVSKKFFVLEVQAADIRLDPTYMLYYTISQIFHPTLTTGIAPMVALIFMNTSIFFGKYKRVAVKLGSTTLIWLGKLVIRDQIR